MSNLIANEANPARNAKQPSRIALLCATQRGYLFLKKLIELAPSSKLTVFSFREELIEPPFFSDIRALAEAGNCNFVEAKRIEKGAYSTLWEQSEFDLLFAVNWRYLVPRTIYTRPRRGAYVFHDSFLPLYRGFSPTVWAIANGEDHTGVTLFEMTEGVDAGRIVAQERVPIAFTETIAIVMERVTQIYLSMLEANLPVLLSGTMPLIGQDETKATYCRKRKPEDNCLIWSRPAHTLYNLVRAVSAPYSGAYTMLNGQRLRVWSASLPEQFQHFPVSAPGRVVEVIPGIGSLVLAGDGAVILNEVQLGAGDLTSAANVLNRIGMTLG